MAPIESFKPVVEKKKKTRSFVEVRIDRIQSELRNINQQMMELVKPEISDEDLDTIREDSVESVEVESEESEESFDKLE